MTYIEKKKVNGKNYFYLSKNVRVSENKWKKIRKYIGKDLSGLQTVEIELNQAEPIKRLLTRKQIDAIELIKAQFLKKNKQKKVSWKTEKKQFVSFIFNTNAIEGNTLGYEDTKDLLEGKKLKIKYKKKDVIEVKNMAKCIKFLSKYKGEFNKDLLLKLHFIEMNKVHPKAGKIRKRQNIVGNYLPPKPEKVLQELTNFFGWFNKAEKILHAFELAALVHLKLVRIHPFMEGNGRISRLLMNYILLKNNYPLLNIFDSEKIIYYLTLKEVDAKKKEKPFIKYLAEVYVNQYKRLFA
ncbi:MAG: Fic family protein [archaeon]